jgi:hypothetical protein
MLHGEGGDPPGLRGERHEEATLRLLSQFSGNPECLRHMFQSELIDE